MKRMIDNKEFNEIKKDIEDHASDYIIKDVVHENEEVLGFIIKDVKNSITYNIDLAGGGKQLYQHQITCQQGSDNPVYKSGFYIISEKSTQLTYSEIVQYLKAHGFISPSNSLHLDKLYMNVFGTYMYGGTAYNLGGVTSYNDYISFAMEGKSSGFYSSEINNISEAGWHPADYKIIPL